MNQILITEKLYVTPELKRKKKIYKFNFMISIFIVFVLISVYIYAEYDRNKSEEVSQSILEEINYDEEEIIKKKNKVLIAVLDANKEEDVNDIAQEQQVQSPDLSSSSNNNNNNANQNTSQKEVHSINGYTYTIEGSIKISKIGIDYPILLGTTGSVEETEALLKSSPCKFHGPQLNEVGNYCIVGHNYRNSRFFSKVPTLVNGDIIEITDLSKRTILYKVYDKHIVKEDDLQDTDQRTNGKKEITLITCTDASNDDRYIVKARQV